MVLFVPGFTMITYLSNLWNADSLSPHGICLLWRPELIWTHAASDALIGLSYLSISVCLAYLVVKRPDIRFGWVVWCFAVFILACGGTHFLSILTLWSPDYGLEAVVKIITAAASVATAVLLWPLLPAALAWPSPDQMAAANDALRVSLKERDEALAALRLEMSERARVEALFNRSQKLESLGHLTGGLAHDYNNMLAIITMNLSRISRSLGSEISKDVSRALDHASHAADRATEITQRMLAFSRQAPMAVAEADVNEVIQSMAPLLRDALGSTHEMTFDLAADLPQVKIDRSQFENAMLNLVLNARDAMTTNGTLTVRSYLSTTHGQSAVAVEVVDSGEGMPHDVIDKAFDPFFTTKPVGRGSGLGLSQVFGFARSMGGDVAIDSLLNVGTTIRVSLPAGLR
jgi:signal transduction histidine kinase